MDDAALITAWATVAIATGTFIVGGITCFLIWRGIGEMRQSSDQRTKDRAEARKDREEGREADLRRHDEAMAKHDATLEALRALIERTTPPAATISGGD